MSTQSGFNYKELLRFCELFCVNSLTVSINHPLRLELQSIDPLFYDVHVCRHGAENIAYNEIKVNPCGIDVAVVSWDADKTVEEKRLTIIFSKTYG